jgi:peptide/nickel transport system substrate-binding protein
MYTRNKSAIMVLVLLALLLVLTASVNAQSDNEYIIRVGESFTTLDTTILSPSNGHRNLMYGLHEPLIRLEPDGSYNPALATDWDMSEDGLTITLNLREGVVFHDGTPFNAEAAVWNIEAGKSEEVGENAMVGYQSVESVEALDEFTVQINMAQPDANILSVIAGGVTPQALIVSPTAYETMGADEYAANPVGTGPFKLSSWEQGVEVVLERFDDYWGEIGSNADRIIWRVIVDNSAATLNYQSGDVHVMFPAQATELPLMESVSGTVVETVPQGYVMMALNTQMPPFDNIHNRRAVRYALDVEPVINLVYAGFAKPAQGVIPPNAWTFNPDAPDEIARDLDAARAELAEAGNPDGFTFEMSVVAQPYRIQTLEIFQANLAEVGIELIIQANERARHIEIIRSNPSLANAAFIQILRFSAAPEDFLNAVIGCQSNNVIVGYCTDEYDALFQSLPGIFDREERASVIQQMDQMVIRDVASIPYVYPEIPLVYRGDILENVGLNGYGLLDWINFSVVGE